MAQLRSELLKLRTTRTTLVLTLGMVALVLAATLGQGLASDAEGPARTVDDDPNRRDRSPEHCRHGTRTGSRA